MLHRYVTLAEFHRLRGLDLRPPSWRPPRHRPSIRLAAEDQDPGYTGWIQKVADYLDRLDQETQRQLKRLGHPANLLQQLPQAAERLWFQPEKLPRLLLARGQATDLLDSITNDLVANLTITNEYLDVVIDTYKRAQSEPAKQALETILDITHYDGAVA